MSVHLNIGGTYKKMSSSYVKIDGAWRIVTGIWGNENGIWKNGYSKQIEPTTPVFLGDFELGMDNWEVILMDATSSVERTTEWSSEGNYSLKIKRGGSATTGVATLEQTVELTPYTKLIYDYKSLGPSPSSASVSINGTAISSVNTGEYTYEADISTFYGFCTIRIIVDGYPPHMPTSGYLDSIILR